MDLPSNTHNYPAFFVGGNEYNQHSPPGQMQHTQIFIGPGYGRQRWERYIQINVGIYSPFPVMTDDPTVICHFSHKRATSPFQCSNVVNIECLLWKSVEKQHCRHLTCCFSCCFAKFTKNNVYLKKKITRRR